MSRDESARIFHADLWGVREKKYDWLRSHDINATPWREIRPRPEFYLFVPRDEALSAAYEHFAPIPAIFPVNSVGIVTARDRLTIQWSPEKLWQTVSTFSRMDAELARRGYKLGKDARDWKVSLAQKDLLDSGPSRDNVVPMLYRPFDVRYTYYTGRSRGFICMPRPDVMRHMLAGENLALITPKQNKGDFGAFAATTIGTHKTVAAYDINYYFPLYLYPQHKGENLFVRHDVSERRPNLSPAIVEALRAAYGEEPSPEDIFNYVYAVLYAPAYRERYAEFLRIDFPRIPLTSDRATFEETASLGGRLVALHLLKSPELDPPIARFEGEGDARVAKTKRQGFRYQPEAKRVYINTSQHFSPVPQEVWQYRIGGYQVCEKWLKDRKGRRLELDDIRTYCRIVTALARTIEIQRAIDAVYPRVEAALLKAEGSR